MQFICGFFSSGCLLSALWLAQFIFENPIYTGALPLMLLIGLGVGTGMCATVACLWKEE